MRTIFLLDIDCFFASVEMALHPELRGTPLCIGGRRGDRGVVACPNYEARAYGVTTAMPLRTAERLLPPSAVFLPGNHRLYGEYSERVMTILDAFTPDVEQVSVDEAYLDVTGCLHLWNHNPLRMAAAMQERIRQECSLTVSIGIASNRVCAKIAAGLRKPNGLVLVPPGQEKEFLAPLPIEVVPGVGKKTLPKLHARGITTIADVLNRKMQEHSWIGHYLATVARGNDEHLVRDDHVEKSISRDTTFSHDTNDHAFIVSMMYHLAERCCETLRGRALCASTVTAKVRFADFTTVQKQTTLAIATAHEEDIAAAAQRMLLALLTTHRPVRLVGVKVSHLSPAECEGSQMVFNIVNKEKLTALHHRLDALREKYGDRTIWWGITTPAHQMVKERKERYDPHPL
jgi:DNA polymerase-4